MSCDYDTIIEGQFAWPPPYLLEPREQEPEPGAIALRPSHALIMVDEATREWQHWFTTRQAWEQIDRRYNVKTVRYCLCRLARDGEMESRYSSTGNRREVYWRWL